MTKEEFENLSNAEKCRGIIDIINGKIKLEIINGKIKLEKTKEEK